MENKNQSEVQEFILQGITDVQGLHIPLFVSFLLIYLVTLLGNGIIMAVVFLNPSLHNPMYFFLCNLSLIDLLYASAIQPKLLLMLLTGNTRISFLGCMAQLHSYMSLICTEFVSLTAMAYDRYVAICNPLRYAVVMNRKICVLLVVTCWSIGFLDPVSHTIVVTHLPFCRSHVLNHFFCDLSVLVKLSCVDTFFVGIMNYVAGSVVAVPAFILIIISYIYIISSILKIATRKSRQKTFSTCVSHLTVVTLFYGTILITYMRPTSHYSPAASKPFSVLYCVLIPMLNPFIYTLRNNDVKKCLCKSMGKQ
ncbi:olfactory receptor 5V1-like [Pelodytes ibericus]